MQHKGLDQGREVHGWWSGVPLISEISEKDNNFDFINE
jgi:hypothetical protein